MRDAAWAAAMSDPDQNRWFRRRWVEVSGPRADTPGCIIALAAPSTSEDELRALGRHLLAQWRRERTKRETVR